MRAVVTEGDTGEKTLERQTNTSSITDSHCMGIIDKIRQKSKTSVTDCLA